MAKCGDEHKLDTKMALPGWMNNVSMDYSYIIGISYSPPCAISIESDSEGLLPIVLHSQTLFL